MDREYGTGKPIGPALRIPGGWARVYVCAPECKGYRPRETRTPEHCADPACVDHFELMRENDYVWDLRWLPGAYGDINRAAVWLTSEEAKHTRRADESGHVVH